jgi:hypothetical protein
MRLLAKSAVLGFPQVQHLFKTAAGIPISLVAAGYPYSSLQFRSKKRRIGLHLAFGLGEDWNHPGEDDDVVGAVVLSCSKTCHPCSIETTNNADR